MADLTLLSHLLTTKTANYSTTPSDGLVLANGDITITVHSANNQEGHALHIKNIGTGTVNVITSNSELIDANTSVELTENRSLSIVSIDSKWIVLPLSGGVGGLSNTDADTLDGQHGSYYTNASNMNTGTLDAARLSGTYGNVTANNTTYAFGKTEGNLNVNSALSANNATYAFGKTEGNLNVNSALSSNNTLYLQGYAVSNEIPTNGQVLTWNAAANTWIPRTTSTATIKLDALTFTGSQTVFTLTSNGTQVETSVPEALIISVGGYIQEPNVAYTVSGNTITFTTAPQEDAPFFGVQLTTAGGSGTGETLSNTYANLPTAGVAGRLFLPTNGWHIFRDNGSAWVAFGPIQAMSVANIASWTLIGNSHANTTRTDLTCSINTTGSASGGYAKSLTSGNNYTITMCLVSETVGYPGQYTGHSFFLDQSDGKCILFMSQFNTGWYNYVVYMNHLGSWSSTPHSSQMDAMGGGLPVWLRVVDDGTDRKYYVSRTGKLFTLVYTTVRTDWIVPTRVGFTSHCGTGQVVSATTLLSFEEV